MSKRLKILLSILALISIVSSLIIILGWNPLGNIKNVFFQPKNSLSDESGEELDEKEIARLTFNWLNNQKNEEGYLVGYNCLKDTDAVAIYSSRIFPSVLWGKLNYCEKSQDNQCFLELEKDLDLALNIPTQNNQWNCKLMKDFWESSFLSEEQKEKAKLYCRETGGEGYSSPEMYDVSTINSSELKSVILKNITNIINGSSVSFEKFYFNDVNSSTYDFEKASVYASNDAIRYFLEKEENGDNQEILDNLFNSSLANYFLALQGYSVLDETTKNNSLLGIASLDLYRLTTEQEFFDIALYLFAQNERIEDDKFFYNYDNVYFAFFTKNLFEVTVDDFYQEKLDLIKDKIIAQQFVHPICEDFEGADNFIPNEFEAGFKSGISNTYFVGENYLILGLLNF